MRSRLISGLVIALVLAPSRVWAAGLLISGYVETGERSTAEVFEEEDRDDDFSYYKYCLKLDHKLGKRLRYNLSSWVYRKDYEEMDDLDNVSRVIKNNWFYLLSQTKEESFRLDLKLNNRQKRYKNRPSSEYDQTKVSAMLTYKGILWSLAGSTGIDNYNYLAANQKDQTKLFGKFEAKRYLRSKKSQLLSSYRLERTDQEEVGRERIKEDIWIGFDYNFELPWLHQLMVRWKWGQKDTKDEEERDEDYDYDYRQWYVKTEHEISPEISTNLKYQYLKKDYLTADLDHSGFFVRWGWRYKLIDEEKRRFWFDLNLKHKDLDYLDRNTNDYRKESVEIIGTYQLKKALPAFTRQGLWRCSLGLEGNVYDYPIDSSRNKDRFYIKLSGQRLFLEGDFTVSVDLKYRYTDYDQKADTERDAVRVAFKYNF